MLRVFDKFCHKLKMDTFTYMYKHTHTNSSNNIPPSQVAGGITKIFEVNSFYSIWNIILVWFKKKNHTGFYRYPVGKLILREFLFSHGI